MILISGFVEAPPPIPGGLWSWDGARLRDVVVGRGIFGVAWWRGGSILIGVTRDDETPVVAFARSGSGLRPLRVRCDRYIGGRRMHGVAVDATRLYAVASQGDPASVVSTNTDRWRDHYVGKVLMSELQLDGDDLIVGGTEVWNPFGCEHHHHYNDILLDDEWIYLSSFSTCDNAKRVTDRGAVTRFRKSDGAFDRVVCDGLNGPHSPQIMLDRIYICSSESSSIVSFPKDGLYAVPRLEYKSISNFIRGLAVTDRHLYVGLSRSAGRTDADRFTTSINGVLQVDCATGVTERIPLPDACENVYSLTNMVPESATRVMFSCVMDAKPKYVAQTRLLVRTLLTFAGCTPDQIVVHAIGDDIESHRFFEAMGVTVIPVNTFDEQHLFANKLAQLNSPALRDASTVVLCDTDLAFCDSINEITGIAQNGIQAKPVDYANFSIQQWRSIYAEASLPFPERLTMSTHDGQEIVPNYCNSGLLVVSQDVLKRLAESWPRWNRFLLDRPSLLGRLASYCDHRGRSISHPLTDQVSLALAISEMGIEIDPLPAQYNMPTHVARGEHDETRAPKILHYHDRLDPEGLLVETGVAAIDTKIDILNELIRDEKRRQTGDVEFWRLRHVAQADGGDTANVAHALVQNEIATLQPATILEATADALDAALPPAELVICLDVLVSMDGPDYIRLCRKLFELATRVLLVSGYNQAPSVVSATTRYLEPLSQTLARIAGVRAGIEIAGGYRDLTVFRVSKT
jgi:hypothetical protein